MQVDQLGEAGIDARELVQRIREARQVGCLRVGDGLLDAPVEATFTEAARFINLQITGGDVVDAYVRADKVDELVEVPLEELRDGALLQRHRLEQVVDGRVGDALGDGVHGHVGKPRLRSGWRVRR